MEETTKKAKAPAKPRKTASKKTTTPTNLTEMPSPASAAAAAPSTNGANGAAHSNLTTMKPSHEQVAMLAHRFWAERGHQHGHHVEDWIRAEHELRGKAS
jgi:Protein of unknown function (DUF2934)